MALDRLAQDVGRFGVTLLAVVLHRLLVLFPRLLPGRDLEGVAGARARDEHGRPRLLRDGAAPRGRIADEHERAGRCVDLFAVDREGRMPLDDDVELLVLRHHLGVLADHAPAGLLGAVGVHAEAADAEVIANRDPGVSLRDLVELRNRETAH